MLLTKFENVGDKHMDNNYVLELEGITKRFLNLVANNNIYLKIKAGEVHTILGENGAGKSTLMNILSGLYTPDSGKIKINGKEVSIKTPRNAISLGIGMVHQHFKLVEKLSVAENILLCSENQKLFINKAHVKRDILKISEDFMLPVNPDAIIEELSVGEKQRVEIIKVLIHGADILILDEPTSVLTPSETVELFKVLRKIKAQGKTIIFITHKLNEVMELADRISIMRSGYLVQTVNKDETNPDELANLMIGKKMELLKQKQRVDLENSEVLLKVKDLQAVDDTGVTILNGVDLEIKKGEILGIAGVSGNGQVCLAEVLTGIKRAKSGQIIFDGKDLTNGKPIDFINAGISHVPEDRIGTGTISEFSCVENAILKDYRTVKTKSGNIDYNKAEKLCNDFKERYNIKIAQPKSAVKLLSGGNMQKLILAREISSHPKLIIAVHPTYGLDISAVEMIRRILVEEQKKGVAILLISEDLEELLLLSDTISVIYKGRLTPKMNREDCTIEDIGKKMMGVYEGKEVV